ncbi:MAG: glycosyltransferase, partial [Chloroflexota bacterium]
MQIGLLTSDLTPHHGWGNYSLNLIESLSDLGHDLTILSATNSEPLNSSAHHCVLPTVAPQETNFIFRLMLSQPKVSKLLAHCDIIHSTIEFYAPLLQWISTKRPTFMTVHGSYVFLPVMRRFPVSWLYKKAFENTHIISVSHYTNEVVKEVVPQAKASVVM